MSCELSVALSNSSARGNIPTRPANPNSQKKTAVTQVSRRDGCRSRGMVDGGSAHLLFEQLGF
jgi:hypothetical protein